MTVLAAALAAGAVWLWLSADQEPRLRALLPASVGSTEGPRLSMTLLTRIASALAAVAVLMVFGGVVGLLLAVGCLLAVPRATRGLQTRAGRDRNARLVAQAPLVADLLSATLAVGSPMTTALAAVCQSVGEPAGQALRPSLGALELGADPAAAWAPLVSDGALGAIATAVTRSAESGAPLSAMLARIAEDLRRQHQAMVEVAARAAGVRAVLPLAACFLPAFLLLGVVPVVAALAGGLLE